MWCATESRNEKCHTFTSKDFDLNLPEQILMKYYIFRKLTQYFTYSQKLQLLNHNCLATGKLLVLYEFYGNGRLRIYFCFNFGICEPLSCNKMIPKVYCTHLIVVESSVDTNSQKDTVVDGSDMYRFVQLFTRRWSPSESSYSK